MPDQMTISKVTDRREWEGNHGKMVTYKIELEGHGPAELNQKPETPAPQVGQSIFGELIPGKEGYPPKLKKVQQGGFTPRSNGRSPEERESIERQVAAKIAADLIIGDKATLDQFPALTNRVFAAIKGDQ